MKSVGVWAGAGLAVLGLLMVWGLGGEPEKIGPSPAQAAPTATVPHSTEQMKLSFSPLVKNAAPAVVNVYAQRIVKARRNPFADDPFFRRFFGDNSFGMPKDRVQNSLGSGVIVGEDGIVVTNNHVIRDGASYTVVLSDRREFEAVLVLADERTDLAVLRIDPGAEKLPTLTFADSDTAEVGDLVLAIGNPFGVGQTVTSGIVSALARTQVGVSDYQFFIQTDAPINPGNSGGALVGTDGTLLGINTAIFSRSGGSNGIGFAIPANMVRLVVQSAVEGGKIVRPWLGAQSQAVTSELAQSLGLERPVGVLIKSIYPGGPADKAGLKVGDLITSVAGFDIFDPEGLRYRIGIQEVGKNVDMTYVRGDKERAAKLETAVPPETPKRNETRLDGPHPLSGATILNLSPAVAEERRLDHETSGVLISAVARGSQARRLGLRRGDILLSLNGREIPTVEEAEDALTREAREWEIRFLRGGRTNRIRVRG